MIFEEEKVQERVGPAVDTDHGLTSGPAGGGELTLESIPLSYLARRGKADVSSIFPYRNYKYLKEMAELSGSASGPQTIGDVLDGAGSEQLRDFLRRHDEAIVRAYDTFIHTDFEPFPRGITPRMTLGQMVSCFISEYIGDIRFDMMNAKSDYEREELELAAILLSEVYLDVPGAADRPLAPENLSYTYTSVSETVGLPKEKARALLQKYSQDMFKVLDGDSVRYLVNPRLEKKLEEVDIKSLGTVPLSTFLQKVGKTGPGATIFLLDYCGMVVFDRCPKIEAFVIPEGLITDVNFALIKLLKRMKDNPIPIPLPTMEKVLGDISPDGAVRATLLSMIKTSEIFYFRKPSEGPVEYGLKWENLDKVSSQITRILYDSGKPLFLDEVLSKYRRQAIECGVAVPEITEKYMRACPLISSSFPGGSWGLKTWVDIQDVADPGALPSAGADSAATLTEPLSARRRGDKSAPDTPTMLRLIAECIHKRGGRAKLTEIKTYIHETSGTVLQVGKVKDYMDGAPDIFKAQAAKARNAYFILRRPVDGIDFQKYK